MRKEKPLRKGRGAAARRSGWFREIRYQGDSNAYLIIRNHPASS
jgi:hypothetical protein